MAVGPRTSSVEMLAGPRGFCAGVPVGPTRPLVELDHIPADNVEFASG